MAGKAVFITGSIMRHVMVMTGAATVGVTAMFAVDLADIWFLSQLGDTDITDAVSFGGTVSFFSGSISIGLMIAMGALVARALGSGRNARARRLATNVFAYAFILTSVVALIVWNYIPELLTLIGASGRNLELANSYLSIIIPSMPFIALAMGAGGLVRAYGDARMTMLITVTAAGVNLVLDPILIFGLDMGIEGAATATVVGRLSALAVGAYVAFFRLDAVAGFSLRTFRSHFRAVTFIAVPAILTNIATPLGAAYTIRVISEFGEGAAGGFAITMRLTHVVFAVMFALSGVIGPIIGQNAGAAQFDRVRSAFIEGLKFMAGYVLIAAAILYMLQDPLIRSFQAEGVAAELIALFCSGLALTYLFSGLLFVANAGFNNLGRPHYSTILNMGRATLGTVPFVHLGALYWGAKGVVIGQAAGGVVFGILAYAAALWHVRRVERGEADIGITRTPVLAKSS